MGNCFAALAQTSQGQEGNIQTGKFILSTKPFHKHPDFGGVFELGLSRYLENIWIPRKFRDV